VLHLPAELDPITQPQDRLRAALEYEMGRLSQEPRRLRLFLEYSVLGTRQPAIRARISAELDRYREAFRTMTAEVIRMEPARLACVTPDGLAAVAVSFINGYAVQAMVDPDHFDIGQYLAAVHDVVGPLARAAA
jgi:hypothetical protein